MAIEVSVIIVNYNTGALLAEAVHSVISLPGVEVIVIDNNSADDSIARLESSTKSKRLTVVRNKDNRGFGRAVNQTVKKAKGSYIYLLNPDAKLTKEALARMISTAKKYEGRAIVAPRLENPDGSPQESCYRPQTIWRAIKEFWLGQYGAYSKYLPKGRSPQPVYAAVAAAWLAPKALWMKLDGFDEKFFLYFEDLDFCNRLHRNGYQMIYDPQAVVKHHHGVSARTNPVVLQLFTKSAYSYHGWIKKTIIDGIIKTARVFAEPTAGKKILVMIAAWIVLLNVFAALGYWLLPARLSPLSILKEYWKSNFLWWSWANFDGEHYLTIARDGYQIRNTFPQYAFFPLYPLLVRGITNIIGDVYLSARIITLTAVGVATYYLTVWAKTVRVKRPVRLLMTILLFPSAVFLYAYYTEALFIALAAGAMYYAEKNHWLKASLITALATATRINGIFLVLFLLMKMRQGRMNMLHATRYMLLALTGLFAYMIYLARSTGNALAFYTAQTAWGKADPTSPITVLQAYARAVTIEFSLDLTHIVVALEILATVWGVYLVTLLMRQKKLDRAYWTYAAANLALPLATGSLGSMPRFLLMIFPAFVAFDVWSAKKMRRLLIAYVIFLAFGTILFTRGYWYA